MKLSIQFIVNLFSLSILNFRISSPYEEKTAKLLEAIEYLLNKLSENLTNIELDHEDHKFKTIDQISEVCKFSDMLRVTLAKDIELCYFLLSADKNTTVILPDSIKEPIIAEDVENGTLPKSKTSFDFAKH